MKCWKCDGKGSVMVEFDNGLGWIPKVCPVCHGKGEENIGRDNILILVDMQNGFRNEFTEPVILGLLDFLAEYRLEKVMATKFVNYDGSLFVKDLGYNGLWTFAEQDIIPEIKPFVSAVYLKDGYGCADSGFLSQLCILNKGVMPESVLLAGFDTEAGVLAVAIGLFDAGIKPFILADFVASSRGGDNHSNGMKTLETLFGMHSLLRLG